MQPFFVFCLCLRHTNKNTMHTIHTRRKPNKIGASVSETPKIKQSQLSGLNWRPDDYKSTALPTELSWLDFYPTHSIAFVPFGKLFFAFWKISAPILQQSSLRSFEVNIYKKNATLANCVFGDDEIRIAHRPRLARRTRPLGKFLHVGKRRGLNIVQHPLYI